MARFIEWRHGRAAVSPMALIGPDGTQWLPASLEDDAACAVRDRPALFTIRRGKRRNN